MQVSAISLWFFQSYMLMCVPQLEQPGLRTQFSGSGVWFGQGMGLGAEIISHMSEDGLKYAA